ncbi:hypothetical protein [Marinitenerispora sediminis]|uniref:Uncharacterized protein n=1 Tax=Marinitenerispora sediminis TaxID=1931232 RepID=A0A368T4B7_9ACTN|nr:hypothetical protein [Marinitenerispora sediminis]RCV57575.1 hypothetical protein DEF28_01225 [Marinitenerispora sediminis]RCV58290.1 hypothetical protein DEF24_13770 [Marinitenerispora sediminis]RCV59679.1 hypothetical protein DEF23_06835 [Marinitenerispora sediminis]
MRPAEPHPGHQDDQSYVEVWNDTVDLRHLAASLVIGVVGGLPLFLLARAVLRGWLDTLALADGYALLAGLAGCLAAGAVCARRFPPKRVFTDDAETSAALRRAALAELARDTDTTTPDLLPAAVRSELAELDLLEDRADSETGAQRPEGAGSR